MPPQLLGRLGDIDETLVARLELSLNRLTEIIDLSFEPLRERISEVAGGIYREIAGDSQLEQRIRVAGLPHH